MSDRRFEMYEYRRGIHRIRLGESDRAIGRTALMGRIKCGQIRIIAEQKGWLDKGMPLRPLLHCFYWKRSSFHGSAELL